MSDKQAMARVIKSYRMMLDFWGMEVKNIKTGYVRRAKNWEGRFAHLNR